MKLWPRRATADPTQKTRGYYPATPLPYVANVSWPRSGHHLLVRLLQGTYGPLFGYCEHFVPKGLANSPCCGAFPCRRGGLVHMSKQHDFDLTAVVPEGLGLVVQYRGFLPSAVSQYEMHIHKSAEPDTPATFRAYAEAMLPTYRGFMDRWVRGERASRVVIAYEDLVAHPVREAEKVLGLYGTPDYGANLRKAVKRVKAATYVDGVEKVAKERGVQEARDETAFRHYDPALFTDLAARAAR